MMAQEDSAFPLFWETMLTIDWFFLVSNKNQNHLLLFKVLRNSTSEGSLALLMRFNNTEVSA